MPAGQDKTDELDDARRRHPLGSQLTGRFTRWILPERPGTAGMVIELYDATVGYVDILALPTEPEDWPPIGTTTTFEVSQHRLGSIRLLPTDPALRRSDQRPPTAQLERCPVGTIRTGVIDSVYVSNREATIRLGEDEYAVAEWSGEPPIIGTERRYEVIAHLQSFGVPVVRPIV